MISFEVVAPASRSAWSSASDLPTTSYDELVVGCACCLGAGTSSGLTAAQPAASKSGIVERGDVPVGDRADLRRREPAEVGRRGQVGRGLRDGRDLLAGRAAGLSEADGEEADDRSRLARSQRQLVGEAVEVRLLAAGRQQHQERVALEVADAEEAGERPITIPT